MVMQGIIDIGTETEGATDATVGRTDTMGDATTSVRMGTMRVAALETEVRRYPVRTTTMEVY